MVLRVSEQSGTLEAAREIALDESLSSTFTPRFQSNSAAISSTALAALLGFFEINSLIEPRRGPA